MFHYLQAINSNQYLNCKVLHGRTLLQPQPNVFGMRKYFSGNYVFPSPKSSEDQKKRSSQKIEEFLSPKSSENQKQKKRLHRNLGLNSAGICVARFFGIYSCWDLFVLPGPFSSVQSALKPRRGDAESRWEDASPRVPPTI